MKSSPEKNSECKKSFASKQLAVIFGTTFASIFIGYVNCDLNSNECNETFARWEILIEMLVLSASELIIPELNFHIFCLERD